MDNRTQDNKKKMTLFVSYAHEDSTEFSEALVKFLKAQGHDVNIDKEFIEGGNDWESKIEMALESTCKAKPDARLVFVLTPQSVNKKKYCMNELAYALSENLSVVPLKLDNVKIPLSIFRIQFIDCQRYLSNGNQHSFENLFPQIEHSLLSNNLDETGFVNTLAFKLEPFESERYTLMWRTKYHEREWIDQEIQAWLNNPKGSKLLCITGGPGFGKSLFAKHLINSSSDIMAYHFCIRNDEVNSNVKKIVKTLACQIASQYEEYRNLLLEIVSRMPDLNLDANTLFDQLIIFPLQKLDAKGLGLKRCKFILIDALDEAIEDSGYSIAFILSQKKDDLPDWIRIIATTRPIPNIIADFGDSDRLNLEDASFAEANQLGLESYLRNELQEFKDQENFEESIATIVERAKGIFLYVANICADIKEKKLCISNPHEFPKSIDHYYANFFTSKFKGNRQETYYNGVAKLLAVILAAREPLDGEMMKRILNIEEFQLDEWVNSLGNFLRTNIRKEYVVYHASLKDWLLDASRNKNYHIDINTGNRIFAQMGHSPNLGNKLQYYQLKHLPKHLSACGYLQDLEDLFNNTEYLDQLDRSGKRHEIVDVYFENIHYICVASPNKMDPHALFKSKLMERLFTTYSLYMFDHNYYAKLTDYGFMDFIEEEDFTELSPLMRGRIFSYYHITERFDLSTKLEIRDLKEKLPQVTDKKELKYYADICNMAGVAHRICGNFDIANQLIAKSAELYGQLGNENAVQVVRANLARSYKYQMEFDQCFAILKEGADYAMELSVPGTFNKTFEEHLHVCNGPLSLIIEYYMNRMQLDNVEECLDHLELYYQKQEAQKGRFYPLFLINKAELCLLKEQIPECLQLLAESDKYPGREGFAQQVRHMAHLYEYAHGTKGLQYVQQAREELAAILKHLASGHQWEKYATSYPLYQICGIFLGEESAYARKYPADRFEAWEEYMKKWYEKVINGSNKEQ